MADGELEVKLVPDEEALDAVEEKQLEVSGEPDSVQEAKEQNEAQTGQLTVIGRSLGRILSVLKQLSIIAAVLAVISKILGKALGIGFEDVRDGIVRVLNSLKDALLDALPFTSGPGTSGGSSTGNQFVSDALGSSLTGVAGPGSGFLGQLLANAGSQVGSQAQQMTDANINLLTSRDALLGDSTQRDMQSDNVHFQILEGGS